MIGGSLFDGADPPDFQVTDVSVISEAAFQAMISDAPQTSTDPTAPLLPDQDSAVSNTPDVDTQPKIAALSTPDRSQDVGEKPEVPSLTDVSRADAQVEAPVSMSPPATDSIGATLLTPEAPIADRDVNGQTQPERLAMVAPAEAPAPRVDTTPAPMPEPDAEVAPETETATSPDTDADQPAEEATEKAPEQATSEIITEAKEKPTASAPLRTSRPKGRPVNLGEKPSSSSDIAKAIARDQASAAATAVTPRPKPTPSGPPLTGREIEGLRLAVRECWNVNPSSEAARITVTISVAMAKSGQPLLNSIRVISSSEGSDSAKRSAYDAARRAIIRCAKGGYKLPSEKYDHWRDIEMTFNPENMRSK